MAKRLKRYLCVGKPNSARGPLWLIWTQGNELYAAFRAMGGYQKFSFHSERNGRREARYALTSEHAESLDLPASERLMESFDRPASPPRGDKMFVPVLQVYFPAGILSLDMDAIEPRIPVHWMPEAPAGYARIFEINYTNETEDVIRESAEFGRHDVIDYHQFPNGDAFFIASRILPFELQDTVHEAIAGNGKVTVYTTRTIIGFKRDCSLATVSVTYGFKCFQTSGYTLSKKLSNQLFPNAKRFRRKKVLSNGEFLKSL